MKLHYGRVVGCTFRLKSQLVKDNMIVNAYPRLRLIPRLNIAFPFAYDGGVGLFMSVLIVFDVWLAHIQQGALDFGGYNAHP